MKPNKLTLIAGIFLVTAALVGGYLLGRSGGSTQPEHDHAATVTEAGETVWTCSMHPQIKLPEPGQCPICFMDLIPLDKSAGTDEGPRDLTITESAKKLSEIVTAPAQRKRTFHEIRTVGFITYDETRVRSITARISGRIEKMYVDYTGIEVTEGEKLFDIYSPDLYAAQTEYLQAIKSNNEILIRSAREKLSLWELTDEQITALETAGDASVRIPIYSPLAGIVVNKFGSDGMYVQTGMPVYTVADLSTVWVELDAYETDLPWIRPGQPVAFTIRSAPGKEFTGRVAFIDPVLDTKTRTVKVRVTVPNHGRKLKPGMFVSGIINSEIKGNGKEYPLVIPATAPLITGKRAVVYVRKEGGDAPSYEGRDVVLGPRAGNYYIVASGITEGEQVVTHGAFKIDAALQIQAKPSMMSPASGSSNSIKKSTVSAAFVKSLAPLYTAYFKAQSALAADDHVTAVKNLKRITGTLADAKTTLLKGAAQKAWHLQEQAIRTALEHVEHVNTLSGIRELFRDISGPVIELQKNFGHTGSQSHYVAFCPMAFDNKGGSWLQNHDTVDNPYYGAAMLRCGEIKETIKGD